MINIDYKHNQYLADLRTYNYIQSKNKLNNMKKMQKKKKSLEINNRARKQKRRNSIS